MLLLMLVSSFSCMLLFLSSAFPVFSVCFVVHGKSSLLPVDTILVVSGTLHLCFLLGDLTDILFVVPVSYFSKFPSIVVIIDSVEDPLLVFFGFVLPGVVVVHPSPSVCSLLLFVLVFFFEIFK